MLRVCVKFSPCSTPQASRKVYFLSYPNFLLCYFNANWFCPTHAAPEEQLQLHTGFCTGWASWKTGFNICLGCCFHSFVTVVFKTGRDLGYFHLKLKVVIPILTYLAFFFCKARKLKSNNSCREESAGALTQVCVLPAARPFVEGISVCKPNSDSINTCHKRQ